MRKNLKKVLSLFLWVIILGGNIFLSNIAKATSSDMAQDYIQPYSCPFVVENENQKIVLFDTSKKLLSRDGNRYEKKYDIPFTLDAGNYKISLTSADGYPERTGITQPKEQYKVVFDNGQESSSTEDLKDNVVFATWSGKVNSNFILTDPSNSVTVRHSAYVDNTSANSLTPVCMLIEKIEKKKIRYCDVDFENINEPKTLTTTKDIYDQEHANHELDYVGKCIDSKIEIEKKAGDIIDNNDGSYGVDYTITVENKGGTGFYILEDKIDIPDGVDINISGLIQSSDDDNNNTPEINSLFNGDDKTLIIENETILSGGKDKYTYTVTYIVSPDAELAQEYCEIDFEYPTASIFDPNLIDFVIIKNNAFIGDGENQKDKTCIELQVPEKPIPTIKIIADKIVCENELDLPNWGKGGPNIDENTVSDFLSQNPSCELIKDWKFQWGYPDAPNPGDDFYGEETDSGKWNTFMNSTEIEVEDIQQIRVREVLEDGYIPFSFGLNSRTNIDDISAEMYCGTDVFNYDNYDFINLSQEDTYYCVAWNVKIEEEIKTLPEAEPVCEDTKSYVKIILNEGSGGLSTVDNTIWFGNSVAPVGVWFELPTNAQTSTRNEGAILTYDNGLLTLGLKTQENNELQDFAGTLEFYGAKVPGAIVEGTGFDKFEGANSFHEDTITKVSNTIIDFDLAVTTANDIASMTVEGEVVECINPELPPVAPVCEDGKRYAKITLNNGSGGLSTVDNIIWFGDNIAPVGTWFELPLDAQTSSHTEGAVLTYANNVLTLGLITQENDERQDFAGRLEFYGARVPGAIVEGTGFDKFEGDTMTKVSNTLIAFDLAVTTANDKASMKLKNKRMFCNALTRIVARKIVCEDESELPNSLDLGIKIKNGTAKNWVKNNKSCSLVEGWEFQYGVNNVVAPDGASVGESSLPGWTTFGPTDSNGKTVYSTRNLENVEKIKIREVLQDGYIPFTDAHTTEPEYSAELYCGSDILNYDNEEWILSPEYGTTTYCVAWNVPKPADPLLRCENNFSVNNEKDLSIIDLSNGTQVYVNDLAFGTSAAAVDPISGNVYYIENKSANPRLAYYDIVTHTNTIVGYTSATSKLFTKAAFNIDGTLYAMTDFANSTLYSIDITTGIATYIAVPKDKDGDQINKDGGDFVFDDKGEMYVIVKEGKFYKVDLTPTSTLAHNMGTVMYNGNPVQSTGLTFRNGLFYVTDNANRLYSFSLTDITDLTEVTGNTNSINDLASCPVNILPDEPEYGSLEGYVWNDLNKDGIWDKGCDNAPGSCLVEPILDGWNVTLKSNTNSVISYTGTTDGNGYYSFSFVPFGDYKLCDENKAGWDNTSPLTNNGCYDVNIGLSSLDNFNFGNFKTVIIVDPPVVNPPTGGGSTPKAVCTNLEINTDLGTSTGSVELTCNGNSNTDMFKLDCGDGSAPQIKPAIAGVTRYATFTCNYSNPDNYTPVCSVSKINPVRPLNYNWITPKTCEIDVTFAPTFTKTIIEDVIVAGGDPEEEILPDTNIGDIYDDYINKKNKLLSIIDNEGKGGVSLLKTPPKILLKTGTPVSDRAVTVKDNRIETEAPKMTKSFVNDITLWKSKLPEIDRNRGEYIVVPSKGLVVPVNYVPENSFDYSELINGRDLNANKYLKTGVMNFPSTSQGDYGEVGNKVIFGHSSYWKFDDGRYKTHFQKIIGLDEGEEIWVYKLQSNGDFKRFVYKITKSFETEPTDVGVLNPGKGSNLTLITCTPIGGIKGRWVVKAKFVNEDKAELENYLYGKNVSIKQKVIISKFIIKLNSLDKTTKEKYISKVFSRIEALGDRVKNNKKTSNMLNYLKLRLAINYTEST